MSPHNSGFEVADQLRAISRGGEFESDGAGLVSSCRWRGTGILVLKPQTYMNRSGEAVIHWLRRLKLSEERLAVAYDDLDLPFATMKMRPSGGAGGHHGMESIIASIGTSNFTRVRIGIDAPEVPKYLQTDYLLNPLPAGDWDELRAAAELGAKAILDGMVMGWPKAMSIHNRREEPPAEEQKPV